MILHYISIQNYIPADTSHENFPVVVGVTLINTTWLSFDCDSFECGKIKDLMNSIQLYSIFFTFTLTPAPGIAKTFMAGDSVGEYR